MLDLPGNCVTRFAHDDGAKQVVNNVHQGGCGRLRPGEFLQTMIFVLTPGILNFGVKRFLAGEVLVDQRFRNARSLG